MYIVAIIISLTLIVILFFALRSTVKRIDYNTKKYFIDKLQDYDYLIEEKKKIINELDEEIEKSKNKLKEEEISLYAEEKQEKLEYYNDLRLPKYMDENLFKKYKNIKDKFSFNKEKLIIKFISSINIEDNDDYEILVNLRKKFTNKKIYEILKVSKQEQAKKIYSVLEKSEIDVIEKYLNINNMKINVFITKIDILIDKNDPTIYIYTGEKNQKYDYISPMIKTVYDKNINEGIKINYKGILYDYSL